jgi:hypothetical protein
MAATLNGGRRVIVRCGSAIERVLRLSGADEIAQLRVFSAHGAG